MSSAPPLGGIAAPPQATVGLAALFTAVSILGTAVPSLAPYLGLVPGYIVTRPWILITCAYFDSNPFKIIAVLACIVVLGTNVEKQWGAQKFLVFIFSTNLMNACSTFLVRVLVFMTTLDDKTLFEAVPCSLGLVASLTVAFKQMMPEASVGVLQSTFVPALVVGAAIVDCIASFSITPACIVLSSIVISWVYLRFFQVHAGFGGTYTIGDETDHFRMVTFFPAPLHPVVEKVSGLFFALFNCSARRAAAKNSTDEFAFGGSAGGSDAGQPFHSLGWNNPAWASPGASSIHGDGSQVSSTPGGLSTPGAVPTPKIPLEDPNASPTVNRRIALAAQILEQRLAKQTAMAAAPVIPVDDPGDLGTETEV